MSVLNDPEKLSALLLEMGYKAELEEYNKMKDETFIEPEIPNFYTTHLPSSSNLESILNTWATNRSLKKLSGKFLSDADIKKLADEYKSISKSNFPSLGIGAPTKTIRYLQYQQMRDCLPENVQNFLSTQLYLDIGGSALQPINYDDFMAHLEAITRCVKHYSFLLSLDKTRSGFVTVKDFIKYVQKFVAELDFVEEEEEEKAGFKNYYLDFVISRFLIVLDPLSTGKIQSERITTEPLFMFFVMLDGDGEDLRNPFDKSIVKSVINDFKNMDTDDDGKLKSINLLRMCNYRLTRAFADRVGDALCKDGNMSFAWYVKFRVAWDSVGCVWANTFLWDALDIDGNGIFTQFEANYFYREICKNFKKLYPDRKPPPIEWVVSEKFDMAGATSMIITKEMFVNNKNSLNFVRHLTDLRSIVLWELNEDIGSLA